MYRVVCASTFARMPVHPPEMRTSSACWRARCILGRRREWRQAALRKRQDEKRTRVQQLRQARWQATERSIDLLCYSFNTQSGLQHRNGYVRPVFTSSWPHLGRARPCRTGTHLHTHRSRQRPYHSGSGHRPLSFFMHWALKCDPDRDLSHSSYR